MVQDFWWNDWGGPNGVTEVRGRYCFGVVCIQINVIVVYPLLGNALEKSRFGISFDRDAVGNLRGSVVTIVHLSFGCVVVREGRLFRAKRIRQPAAAAPHEYRWSTKYNKLAWAIG